MGGARWDAGQGAGGKAGALVLFYDEGTLSVTLAPHPKVIDNKQQGMLYLLLCGSGVVGIASASQAEDRGFESRLPLHLVWTVHFLYSLFSCALQPYE